MLIRPSQAESTKGKNVIIGDERPLKKMTQKKVPPVLVKASTLRWQDKEKKTDIDSTNLIGSNVSLTGAMTCLTGTQTGLTGASSKPGRSSKAKNKTRPSFKKILAKYDTEGNAQKQKERPNKVKDAKSTFTSGKQSDSQPCQDSCAAMSYSKLIAP